MNHSRKNNKKRPRTRPGAEPSSARSDSRALLKIADTSDRQDEIASKLNLYLPEAVTISLNGEEEELKTLENFSIWLENTYDNCEIGDPPSVEINVDNALNWHEGSIQGVVKLIRSCRPNLRRDGAACNQGDVFDILLQTHVDAGDIEGYSQLKFLMLQFSARYYPEQQPPRIISLKQRLEELGFKGDDLRQLKRKELEYRKQAIEEQVDSVPAYARTPIYETIQGIPLPINSRKIVAPRMYGVTWMGVVKETERDRIILSTPLVIAGSYKDLYSGTVLVKLVFLCQGKFVSLNVTRDTICDKRKLLELSKFGLPVTNDNVMEVVRYLQAFEQDNQYRMEHSATTSRLGIHRVERKVPKITSEDIKLSRKSLSNIKRRVKSRLSKQSSSSEFSKKLKSQIAHETRLAVEKARQKKAARLLRECEEATRDRLLEPPELPDGFETIETTVFVLPGATYSSHGLEPTICFQSSEAEITEQVAGFRSKGDDEAWVDLVKQTASFPQVRLSVVAAFAPLLRLIVEFPNLILDFCGRTTSGKTTALRLAAAGFGCPNQSDSEGSVVFSLAGTPTFNERRAGLLRNLPLFLDESKLANAATLSKFSYMLSSGTSKGRGTVKSVQSMTKFETIGIFTGEQPIIADSNDGGTRLRAIPFFGGPFGDESAEIGQLADQINDTVEHNYGHALPAMLKYIFANQGRWPGWKKLFEKYKKELKERADDADNKYAARLAPTLAAFKLTENLMAKCLKIPSIDVVDANWENFVLETSFADRSKLALEFVYSYAVQNRERFWDPRREYGRKNYGPSNGWLGRWDLELNSTIPSSKNAPPGWGYIGFIPAEIRKLLEEHEFDADAVLRQWKLDDVLVCDANRNDRQVTFGADKNRIRLVCISKASIDALDCGHEEPAAPSADTSHDGPGVSCDDDNDAGETQVSVEA